MRKFIRVFALMLSICIMFVSCANKDSNKNGEEVIKRPDNEILIWSHFGGFDDAIKEFTEENPEYTVKVKTFEYNEYVKAYLDVLGTENEPDIMIIDSNEFGMFNTLDNFEDLLQEPYDIGKYQKDFDTEAWEVGKSLDGNKMISVAYASAPFVTYYRRDIMKENDFPDDPEELGNLMADPEEWLKIANKLKNTDKGIFITQWAADPVTISTRSFPKFDKDLNFLYETEPYKSKFIESIDIAKRVLAANAISYQDIWTEKGEGYLKDDRFAMLYLGSWGASTIENIVGEDQKGKWGVTRLPFDVYAWSNCSMMSIPKKAQNKEGAWKFVEYFTFERLVNSIGSVSTYRPLRDKQKEFNETNDFLGGQNEQAEYLKIMDKTQEYAVTALDQKIFDIWVNELNKGLESRTEMSAEEIYKEIVKAVEERTKEDKEIIKELIYGNK